MMKIVYSFRIIYSVFRSAILFVISMGHIRISVGQMISPRARFQVEHGGRINVSKGCVIEEYTKIHADGGKIEIKNTFLNRNCNIVSMGCISICDATIAPNVCIYDHNHAINYSGKLTTEKPFEIGSVEICEGAWVGANATVLKDVIIGKHSVIGAGSVVVKNVKKNSIVGVVPARLIRYSEGEDNE